MGRWKRSSDLRAPSRDQRGPPLVYKSEVPDKPLKRLTSRHIRALHALPGAGREPVYAGGVVRRLDWRRNDGELHFRAVYGALYTLQEKGLVEQTNSITDRWRRTRRGYRLLVRIREKRRQKRGAQK